MLALYALLGTSACGRTGLLDYAADDGSFFEGAVEVSGDDGSLRVDGTPSEDVSTDDSLSMDAAPPACGPDDCIGCCQGSMCLNGSSDAACGSGGAACADCSSIGAGCVGIQDPEQRPRFICVSLTH